MEGLTIGLGGAGSHGIGEAALVGGGAVLVKTGDGAESVAALPACGRTTQIIWPTCTCHCP